jgi:hypothetical protein
MANIKTTGGKVITKDGKVSCTCCGDECCLYPADGLGTLYSEDDLPDVIYYDGDTLTRVGSAFVGDDYEINNTVESGQWTIVSDLSGGTASYGSCLITSSVTDNFPDTLTVTDGQGSFAVSRVSRCRWESTPFLCAASGETTVRANITWSCDEFYCGWIAGTVFAEPDCDQTAEFGNKSGNQNTPVGTYTPEIGSALEVT